MAFPVAASRTNGITNSGSITVTIPGTKTTDDYVIILLKSHSSAKSWGQTSGTTGWNELADANGMAVYWKKISSSEANPSFDQTSSGHCGYSVVRVDTHDTAIDPEINTEATGSSVAANSGSITPTGGAKDYLFIAMCGVDDGRYTVDAAPTIPGIGYLNLNQFNTSGGGGGGCSGATAERSANVSSEDAGFFTLGGTSVWQAYTVVVHPGGVGPSTKEANGDDTATGTVAVAFEGSSVADLITNDAILNRLVSYVAPNTDDVKANTGVEYAAIGDDTVAGTTSVSRQVFKPENAKITFLTIRAP